jgi:hypothetical protein
MLAKRLLSFCLLIALVMTGTAAADWSETFDNNSFDLATWNWGCYPDMTSTFTHNIANIPGPYDYLTLRETTPFNLGAGSYGSAFGMGFPNEVFTDVRVGAVINVAGDASRHLFGIVARANYFVDDGSISGAPGMVATGAYLLIYHLEDGPANVRIEILKIYMNDDVIMKVFEPEVPVPGLDRVRSHYVELDVVGSGPVYVTGRIYEYKGGPLLVRTPTMVDTSGNDPWENPGLHDGVYDSGMSGIFSINQDAVPVGYHSSFDSVSSVSDVSFTVGPCLAVDDFESYDDDAAIAAKWVDNITGVDYVFLDTGTETVHSGAKAMRLEYQNQYAPYVTEATRTFADAQDWTENDVKALSLYFRGIADNVEQVMYVTLEDTATNSHKVTYPYTYACQSELWREWTIDLKNFSDAGVILAAIKKVTIGLGNGTNSGQAAEDRDTVYIDDIQLCPCRCFNSEQLDLRGDANGDCEVNFEDLAVMANGWLNDGLSVTP